MTTITSHIRKTALAALLLITTLLVFGNTKYNGLKFQQITTDQGLPFPGIREILQDHYGFIWIATRSGVYRYDGINYVAYRSIPGIESSLGGNDVISIFEDSKKRLWMSTINMLCYYNHTKDNFINIPLHGNITNSITAEQINFISEDSNGTIWLANTKGCYKVIETNNIEDIKFSFYGLYRNKTGAGKSLETHYFTIDNNKTFWAATDMGLFYYNQPGDTFLSLSISGIDDVAIFEIKTAMNGNLLLGTQRGLYVLKCKNGNCLNYDYIEPVYTKDSLSVLNFNSLIEDKNHALWIGSANGIYIFPPPYKKHYYYTNHPYDNRSLSNELITDFYEDKSGIMWIGTREGISLYDENQYKFELYNKSTHPKFTFANGITEDHHGNIWICSSQGGLFFLNRKTNKLVYINQKMLPGDLNFSITYHRNNIFWLTGYHPQNGGLYWMHVPESFYTDNNPKKIKFKKFTAKNLAPGTNFKFLKQVFIETDTSFFVTGRKHGLMHVAIKGNIKSPELKFTQYVKSQENKNYPAPNTACLFEDSKNRIWIGARGGGVFVMNRNDNSFISYSFQHNNPKSLNDHAVSSVAEDNMGNIWLGTYNGGLNKFNEIEGNFTRYNENTGLPANKLYGIISDTLGNLWLTSNTGLIQFNTKTESSTLYTQSDGIQGYEFSDYSYYKLKSGEIAVGGTNGINIFNPLNVVKKSAFVPKTQITNLKINYKNVPIKENNDPEAILTKSLSETNTIQLNHQHQTITIEFAGLSYSKPEKNLYQYKLEDFDNDWIPTTSKKPYATYNNLPGGTYVFKVKSANSDGIWNQTPTTLTIKVIPPFYKRPIFKLLGIFSILLLVTGIYLYRLRAIQHQKNKLEKLVKKRTEEIEEKNTKLKEQAKKLNKTNTLLLDNQHIIREQKEELSAQNENLQNAIGTKDKLFSIIAHDLKNPFNSILGFAQLLQNRFEGFDENKRMEMVNEIYKSTYTIYKLLENLLQWSHSQTGNISFNPKTIDLHETIEDIIRLLGHAAERKQNTLLNNIAPNFKIFADYNMLHTILRNLLNNSIKFTVDGTISFNAKANNNHIDIWVNDNGIGMPPNVRENLFKIDKESKHQTGTGGETGTGLGLIICKEFIEYHQGSIEVESMVGKGTKVKLIIPTNKK